MMRILVYPHDLGMGGSQLNAIELACAVRDLGHEVVLYGEPGVLVSRADELGLEFIASPTRHTRPTPGIVRHLRALVRERDIDIVHGYEWPPIVEGQLACLGGRVRCVGTVMSMSVAPFISRHLPLVVGTRAIAADERAAGRTDVTVIEPPVDTVANAPDQGGDLAAFRAEHGLRDGGLHLVCVTRLARELKLEGLLTAIEVVPQLGDDLTLTIVGGGPEAGAVREAAERANASAGRRAVVLTGQTSDPRPAYAMADIVLGMGGSALRALAFAKPLIVQGEQGFWKALSPDTVDQFLFAGWFGQGDGVASGAAALRRELSPLLTSPGARARAGRYSRTLVEERFSLHAAGARQLELYRRVARSRPRPSVGAGVRSGVGLARYTAGRLLNRGPSDDFNSNLTTVPR